MKLVVVRHLGDSGKYLFQLPETTELEAGTTVLCRTKRNPLEPGVCVTPSFDADPAVICPLWGTQPERMQKVIKVLREFSLPWPEEEQSAEPDEEEEL